MEEEVVSNIMITEIDELAEQDAICKKCNFDATQLDKVDSKFSTTVLIERCKTLKTYQAQLEVLKKIPLHPQKSKEWYKQRENLVTASDFGQSLGDGLYGLPKQVIIKKCDIVDESSFDNPAFRHGNLYEDVAVSIYEHIMDVTIHDFGLIKHPTIEWFGASPDGISDLGIMLEIKCPWKRILDGHIPLQYMYQIQGQLDTCQLSECHYLELQIKKYDNYDSFLEHIDDTLIKGIVVENVGENPKWNYSTIKYEDSPLHKEYFDTFLQQHVRNTSVIEYYFVERINLRRVKKDPEFLREKLGLLKDFWENILMYRNNHEKFLFEVKKRSFVDTVPYIGKITPKRLGFLPPEDDIDAVVPYAKQTLEDDICAKQTTACPENLGFLLTEDDLI